MTSDNACILPAIDCRLRTTEMTNGLVFILRFVLVSLKNVCILHGCMDSYRRLIVDDLFDQLILIFDLWFLIAWVLDACGCYFCYFSIG